MTYKDFLAALRAYKEQPGLVVRMGSGHKGVAICNDDTGLCLYLSPTDDVTYADGIWTIAYGDSEVQVIPCDDDTLPS